MLTGTWTLSIVDWTCFWPNWHTVGLEKSRPFERERSLFASSIKMHFGPKGIRKEFEESSKRGSK